MLKGLITDTEMAELKETFKDEPLLKWPIPPGRKNEVIFTTISTELKQKVDDIIAEATAKGTRVPLQEIHELLIVECLRWPQLTADEVKALPFGAVHSLAKVIQEQSGYIDVDIMNRVLGPATNITFVKDFNYWEDITDKELTALHETPFAIYRIKIGRWIFYIRPMTRVDIQQAIGAVDDQLALVKNVVMWPQEISWNTIPAGVVEKLAAQSNNVSGWDLNAEVEAIQ